jgi:hypothetical protein
MEGEQWRRDLAEKSTPARPDVTLAVLRQHALELVVSHVEDECDFELLNLSLNPTVGWDAAVKVACEPGTNWLPAEAQSDLGRLLLDPEIVDRLALEPNHSVLIRQVSRDGEASVQSLFRVVVY